jgi:hypothetical protein
MADDIIQFAPGGKVTAEETNENNLLLKEWALDNSQSEAYIDGKIATLTNNLNSQISSLNSQIAAKAPSSNPTLTGTVKVPNNAAVGTAIATAAISKAGNGYVKFGNGIIIQWGRITMKHRTVMTITFPTSFASTNYSVCLTGERYTSTDKDKTDDLCFTYNAISKTAVGIYTYDAGDNSYTAYVRWVAIGY